MAARRGRSAAQAVQQVLERLQRPFVPERIAERGRGPSRET
jgi:hypothetical protein